MILGKLNRSAIVNCRIGSLENSESAHSENTCVNCRIGSLENSSKFYNEVDFVNCRIGSLENLLIECLLFL